MKAYKLFKVRKNGTIGSLFIHSKDVLPLNTWLQAHCYPTNGFKVRPGWHSTPQPFAPHLSMKDRKWFLVDIKDVTEEMRPKSQGGLWFLSQQIKILKEIQISKCKHIAQGWDGICYENKENSNNIDVISFHNGKASKPFTMPKDTFHRWWTIVG